MEDFFNELVNDVNIRADSEGVVSTLAFISEIAERLEDEPAFGNFEPIEYEGRGTRNKLLKAHGFTHYEETDASFGLVIAFWQETDKPATINALKVMHLFSAMENLINEVVGNDLSARIEESSPAYEMATILRDKVYSIQKFRLHLFTNLILSSRFKEELSGDVHGIPLERHIWDLERFFKLYTSNKSKEVLEINVLDFYDKGIPCILAAKSEDYEGYQCVVDAGLLANLFDRYGSRLLEGNVRSFLGMKGKVNKGIKNTIRNESHFFFAYNNGIAATAAEILIDDSSEIPRITHFTDLQIVNGGQTTATILNARKQDKLSLEGIAVPMKLTRVSSSDAQRIIPRIAEYANTQNKINSADFFANHPFHQKMESISRRLWIPHVSGQLHQSKWFYERSRGQYQNERIYLTGSKKKSFELEYPKNQLVSKTDLAKFHNTFKQKPYTVSLGAQKNFDQFAKSFGDHEHWDRVSTRYNEQYFRNMVAIGIIWKALEKIIDKSRDSWYQGGYRANIITYTISKLVYEVQKNNEMIDFDLVWRKQQINEYFSSLLGFLAESVQKSIINPPSGVKNVGEWCKKEVCWKAVKQLDFEWGDLTTHFVMDMDEWDEINKDGITSSELEEDINLQLEVVALAEAGYWQELLYWNSRQVSGIFNQNDKEFIRKISTPTGAADKTDRQYKKAISLKKRAEAEGFAMDAC